MRFGPFIVAALVVAPALPAQESDLFDAELRPAIGAFVPLGAERNEFRSGTLVGVQAALELSRFTHLVASVGWAHSHAKFPGLGRDLTYIWGYDAGVEFNAMLQFTSQWLFRPFVGLGVGGRTYDYRARGVGTRTCVAGYASLGTEFERGGLAFRFEARDYVACVESPISGEKHTRTDLGLTLGFAYHLR